MQLNTPQLLAALRSANPAENVTEDRLRHAIRRGVLRRPQTIGRQFVWGPDDVQAVAEVLNLDLPADAQALGRVIGTRRTLHLNRPDEDYDDNEVRLIGGRLGWEWAGESDQVSRLRAAEADGALEEPTAQDIARVFLPKDEWSAFDECCWWEEAVGDYAGLTERQPFVAGFIAGALLRH